METRDLLLEIGVEEIPARFLPPAIKQINQLAADSLKEAGLPYQNLHVYATPRRLTLLVEGLATAQEASTVEVKGPALASAYDTEGKPTRALEGFCKGHGLTPEALEQRELKGNVYLYAVKHQEGQTAGAVLPKLLADLIHKIYFPKPMRWGYEEMRFARPIHWLVTLFGEELLEMEIATVQSGRLTRGHRVLGSQEIVINRPAEYLDKLRENYVICDQTERREMVWNGILEVAKNEGGLVKENEELLTEVVFLVEYPTALAGSFEEKYLELPEELVSTPMCEHQRYFPVHKPEGGLLNRFITVRNGDARFLEKVAHGNEMVLRARLADAEFFWQEDLKQPLCELVSRLSEIVFHEKLGTMLQKVDRIQELAEFIAENLNYTPSEITQTKRAAYLAKADLLSHAVYEFTELQGIMGEYYALEGGEDPVVAQAIREHYQPRFAGDEVPQSKPGIAVALADKLDTLCGFFAIGIIPSGSQDPYALRRAASGCVQIVQKHGLYLSLQGVFVKALDLIKRDMVAEADQDRAEKIGTLLAFMRQRLANALSEEGLSYDIIQAIENDVQGDLYESIRKAQAIRKYRESAGFGLLLEGFTRAANLLRSAEQKGEQLEEHAGVEETLLREEAESKLHRHIQSVKQQVHEAVEQRRYEAALELIGELSQDINAFFEAVMVMDKDEAVRRNRLALLQQVVEMAGQIGDLSKLQEK